jgi:hypothetical protein
MLRDILASALSSGTDVGGGVGGGRTSAASPNGRGIFRFAPAEIHGKV